MPEESLEDRLWSRVDECLRGDPRALLSRGTLTDLAAVREATVDGDGRVPFAIALLIGIVHWHRHTALPAGKDEAELTNAINWLRPIAREQPWLIPEALMAHLVDERAAAYLGEPSAAASRVKAVFLATMTGMKIESLSPAIDEIRALIGVIPPRHPDYLIALHALSMLLRSRFEAGETRDDIDQAVDLGRIVVRIDAGNPVSDQWRSRFLNGLALAHWSRYDRRREVEDLNHAAHHALAALKNVVDVGDGISAMTVLCWAQHAKFVLDRDPADLDSAIEMGRIIVDYPGPTDFKLAVRLTLLQAALHSRFEQTGSVADLDEAGEIAERAVEATSPEDSDIAFRLSTLGIVLRSRFERYGETTVLDRAIESMRRARDAMPVSDPNYCLAASNLSATLTSRFERTGDRRDIEDAVASARSAVKHSPDDLALRHGVLTTLGATLRLRFEWLDDAADLEEAIAVTRQALAAVPETDTVPLRNCQGNLSNMLLARFKVHGRPQDLDEAVTTARAAVTEDAGRPHPQRITLLSNFSGVLAMAYLESQELELLEGAIAAAEIALEATPADAADLARQASNLGDAYLRRHLAAGEAADLRRALELAKRAHASTAPDDPSAAITLLRLVQAARADHRHTGSADELDQAFQSARQAIASPTSAARDRIKLCAVLAETAAERAGLAAALPFYRTAIGLIPLVVRRDLATDDRLRLIDTSVSALACEAAACAIAIGDPELAVTLLERGRGVLWGSLLDTRTELDALHAAYPAIAEEFDNCRRVLDRPRGDFNGAGAGADTDAAEREARRGVGRRLDELVDLIRGLEPAPGFPHPERFLEPTPLPDLLPPPATGPVVVLNISRWRCDALIVTAEGVEAIALGVSASEFEAQVARYLVALQVFGSGDMLEQVALETECRQVLRWLWHGVTGPVLDHMGFTAEPSGRWPRVWWCPTGLLSLLPLHAAQDPAIEDACVLDRVVSSYAPTLRSLAHARRSRSAPQEEQRMLVATIPDMPDAGAGPRFAKLVGAQAERDLLREILPPHRRTELTGDQVTHASLLNELGRHRWAHLSCHGVQDLRRPAAGGLVPFDWQQDGLVGVNDLIGPSVTTGDFVFLSACQTATGGISGVDEAVNLASAMHYGGWQHVIGTLWTVNDDAARFIADEVYNEIGEAGHLDTARSPYALHRAIRRLRDRDPDHHSLWGRFVHLGP